MPRRGRLTIYFGGMFSGKSSEVTAAITRLADIGLHSLYVNAKMDDREVESKDPCVTTHNSQFKGLSHKVDGRRVDRLKELRDEIDKYDVIGIDEGQFFPDLVPFVRELVLKKGKRVFVASLSGNFDLEPFGKAHELICIAEEVVMKKAVCQKCIHKNGTIRLEPAPFTDIKNRDDVGVKPEEPKEPEQPEGAEEPEQADDKIKIGGADIYIATCLRCHSLE